MGVWIETRILFLITMVSIVTPCMGVWIETFWHCPKGSEKASHPVWVCGLKLGISKSSVHRIRHTLYGCVD